MKVKISVSLPSREQILEGLTPHAVYPALAKAEDRAADAERALERTRRELADIETRVAELPARITRGEIGASALVETIRQRDAAALLVPPAVDALAKARERVAAEEKASKAAVERETEKRWKLLESTAADLAPVLQELHDLAYALAGPYACLPDWCCAPSCDSAARARVTTEAWASAKAAAAGRAK